MKMFDLLMNILDNSMELEKASQLVFDYINESQEDAIYELYKMTRIDSKEEPETAMILRSVASRFMLEVAKQLVELNVEEQVCYSMEFDEFVM